MKRDGAEVFAPLPVLPGSANHDARMEFARQLVQLTLGTRAMRAALGEQEHARVSASLRVVPARSPDVGYLGRCDEVRLVIYVNAGASSHASHALLFLTVVHEVVHLKRQPRVLLRGGRCREQVHGAGFYKLLAEVVDEMLGTTLRSAMDGYLASGRRWQVYDLDDAIYDAIRRHRALHM